MAWLGLKVLPKKADENQRTDVEAAAAAAAAAAEKSAEADVVMAEKDDGDAGETEKEETRLEAMHVGGGDTVSLPSGQCFDLTSVPHHLIFLVGLQAL